MQVPGSGLLGHIAGRFVAQTENLATESLLFLLQSYPVAADAFVRFASQFVALPADLRFSTQDRDASDGAIPDLVGVAGTDVRPLIVEAKFWASLTDHQPVTYLRRLPRHEGGLLLFVAPERRQVYLFGELLRRCRESGLTVSHLDAEPGTTAARVGQHVLAITSWRKILGSLEAALEQERQHDGLADLGQLAGLCASMEQQAFLPLTSEELTGTIGQRILGFLQMIEDATGVLVNEGKASTDRVRKSTGATWVGRWLILGGWEVVLHVNYKRWGTDAPTPLWLTVKKAGRSSRSPAEVLAPFRHREPRKLFPEADRVLIPLYLSVGAHREQALEELLRELREVHDLLAAFPPAVRGAPLAVEENRGDVETIGELGL